MVWDGPKWGGREGIFPANPDLADVLGDTYLILRMFILLMFLDSKVLDVQVSRFPKIWPGPGGAWALGLGQGRAWALGWVALGL